MFHNEDNEQPDKHSVKEYIQGSHSMLQTEKYSKTECLLRCLARFIAKKGVSSKIDGP